MIDDAIRKWLATRKEAALRINPETADVFPTYVQIMDPYRDPDLPEEYGPEGLGCFARSPGGDTWVWFGDLPEAICDVLQKKHRKTLALVFYAPAPPSDAH
jgi:hypothetical protein